MSFYKPRIGNATFPGPTFHPVPENHASSPSSTAATPQRQEPPAVDPPEPTVSDPELTASAGQADLLCLADVEPQSIDWLWKDRLAAGSLAILSGDPGSGKTWVALAIAAALSRGREPAAPSGSGRADPCTILYASAGNEAAGLLRPRFTSLDGDPARLVLLRGAFASGSDQSASPALRGTAMLENALQRTQARLLIIDPLHSYLSAIDSHRAHSSVRTFDSLAHLAHKYRCCILLVRHLPKRGRGLAPIELSAAARTEFLAGSSPDAPTRPALVQVKSNLGPLAPSLGYSIGPTGESAPTFCWTGPSKLTPEDVMTDRPVGPGMPRRRQAAEWLRQNLCDGTRSQANLAFEAEHDGISIATLRRAKCDLGVVVTRDRIGWYWTLPDGMQPPSTPVP